MSVTGKMKAFLTDDEIRQLRAVVHREPVSEDRGEVQRASFIALDRRFSNARRVKARARCLEAWNTRQIDAPTVTEQNITDEQIRESGAAAIDIECALARPNRHWTRFDRNMRLHARARCAQAFNARHEGAR